MEIGMKTNDIHIAVTLAALFVGGVIYNYGVALLGDRQRGFTSLLVAFGVLFTLAGIAIIDWQCAQITLAGFAASGTPMIIGSVARYIAKRHAEESALAKFVQEALDDSKKN